MPSAGIILSGAEASSSGFGKLAVASALLAFGAAGALAIRFSGAPARSTLADRPLSGPPIVASTVRRVPLAVRVKVAGQTRARRGVDLASEVAGRLVEVGAEVGDELTAGAVAFRLDERDARLLLADRRARFNAARARAGQSARRADRRSRLGREGVSPAESVEQAELDRAVAEADLAVAEKEVALAERGLEKLAVRAPWRGRVVERRSDPGAWVVPGQPVLRVLELARLDVWIDLPSRDAVHLRPGHAARVRFAALPGESFVGRLRFVAAEAAAGDLLFPAAVEIDGDPRMAAGMVAEVELDLSHRGHGVAVPLEALGFGGETNWVWLVRDGRLEKRTVIVDSTRGGRAILSSGLLPGERVMTVGPAGVEEGMRVGEVAEAVEDRSEAAGDRGEPGM